MANVLPSGAQKKVWAMYRSRLLLVTGLVVLGLAVAGALTLIPSLVALQIAAPEVSETLTGGEIERESAIALERSQFLIDELGGLLSATSSAMNVVEVALDAKPSGVTISRIMYAAGNSEDRITLIGSGSRESVSTYKDALTKLGVFDGVSVPVGALVGSGDGGFSVVLTGQF